MALLISTPKVTNNDKGLTNCTDNTGDYPYPHYISMHRWKKHFKMKKVCQTVYVIKMSGHNLASAQNCL